MTKVIKVHFDAQAAEDALNDLIEMCDDGEGNFDWTKVREKFDILAPYVNRICEQPDE